jgi:undecaprenyl-diphosphatase
MRIIPEPVSLFMNDFLLSVPQDWTITFLASFLLWFMYAGIFVLWLGRPARRRGEKKIEKEQAVHALVASIITWIIVEMLKSLIPSTRPFQLSGYSPLTLTIPQDNSFPSSHAAVAFALAVGIWLHDKKTGWLFVAAAIGVSMGRILANVHFIFDIIVGGWIGIVVAYGVSRMHFFGKKQLKP